MKKQSMAGFKRGAQAGFTLIELVVVIVILGILAATALPKFADLGTDARVAKMNAAAGAIKAAAAMAHSAWLASGASLGSVTLEGVSVTITNGYPDASTIAAAAGGLSDYVATPVGTVLTVLPDSAATRTACAVTYTEAAAGAAPAISIAGVTAANCN